MNIENIILELGDLEVYSHMYSLQKLRLVEEQTIHVVFCTLKMF